MPDTSGLVITTVLDTTICEVENKIPVANGFVKKTDYDSKISDIEKNISLLLIIINSQKKYLMQRQKKKI